jgi:hypothetical protein
VVSTTGRSYPPHPSLRDGAVFKEERQIYDYTPSLQDAIIIIIVPMVETIGYIT